VSSLNDRNPSDDPKPDYPVSLTVPEEFAGVSLGEVNKQGGMIKAVNAETGTAVIQALIPESRFNDLASAISEWTQGRGRVERQHRVNE